MRHVVPYDEALFGEACGACLRHYLVRHVVPV